MREGVQDFARAALAGGIPYLLASKWSVLVKESMTLMTRFYVYMPMNKVREPGPDIVIRGEKGRVGMGESERHHPPTLRPHQWLC